MSFCPLVVVVGRKSGRVIGRIGENRLPNRKPVPDIPEQIAAAGHHDVQEASIITVRCHDKGSHFFIGAKVLARLANTPDLLCRYFIEGHRKASRGSSTFSRTGRDPVGQLSIGGSAGKSEES